MKSTKRARIEVKRSAGGRGYRYWFITAGGHKHPPSRAYASRQGARRAARNTYPATRQHIISVF